MPQIGLREPSYIRSTNTGINPLPDIALVELRRHLLAIEANGMEHLLTRQLAAHVGLHDHTCKAQLILEAF